MKQFLIICILLITSKMVISGTSGAENLKNYNPRFELFNLPGAETNKVQQIVQDKLGYLWFATQNGLIRYDGQRFISYNHNEDDPNSIQSDYVESIFIDSKGLFWLTHWQSGSLTLFDPSLETFKKYSNVPDDAESLLPGELSVVMEDKSGYIWIGGQNGLNRLDRNTGKVKRFQNDPANPNSLSCNNVRSLYTDSRGTLWVGTGFPWADLPFRSNGGLNRYNPENETFTRYMHDPDNPNTLANNIVRAMLEDSMGNFWIGTGGDGLHLMDRESGKFTRLSYNPQNPEKLSRPYPKGLNPETSSYFSHVTSIYEDRQNRIWISAVEGGLNVYDPQKGLIRHFEQGPGENDLKTNFIWSVFQSRDNTLWITTGGDGAQVYKVKDRDFSFPFFKFDDKLGNAEVHGILKDREGRIWISQNNPGRVLRIDREKNLVEEIPIGEGKVLYQTFVGSLSMDNEGNIWLSTFAGYYCCKAHDSEFRLFKTAHFQNDSTYVSPAPVLQSKNGIYWFPIWWDGGLARYNPKTDELTVFNNDPEDPSSISGDRILGLYEDDKEFIWIGGGSVISESDRPLFVDRYNPYTNSFEHYFEDKKLKGNAFDFTSDDKGNIWFIDYFDGLFKLNPFTKELKKLNLSKGLLPKSQLSSLTKDAKGKFWLSTDQNLLEFDPESEALSVFGQPMGIQNSRSSYNCGISTRDGELYFARENGFHYLTPEILSDKKNIKPDIHITGFQMIDDQTNNPGTTKSIINSPYFKGEKIQLTHQENVFSFSVANFNFYNPEINRVQYMLAGFDHGWRNELIDGNTPFYINVPPGNYTFMVRGTNTYGILSTDTVRMNLTILPPWWKSFWAYVIYGFILIFGIFAVDRIQRRRLLEKERALSKEKELQQAREIEKAYTQLKSTQAQLIQAEKMAGLGEITAGIAHEMRNPLNFVKNFSEVSNELIDEMKEELAAGNIELAIGIADNIKQNLGKISLHGKHAESIVKGMLLHSRASNGKKEPTDINALCDEYLHLSFHGFKAKEKSFNAYFKLEADEALPRINVVPQDISRVVLNLINNAFYAVNEKTKQNEINYNPSVVVKTRRINGNIAVSVIDNGNGIPDSLKDKIFQPFFTTKPNGEGTGLGLSLSYDIVKAHGGEINVESKEGGGSEFSVHLPV
jgi:signal transduction histidine kinase/ligand-binding sensor domain-containing protein